MAKSAFFNSIKLVSAILHKLTQNETDIKLSMQIVKKIEINRYSKIGELVAL